MPSRWQLDLDGPPDVAVPIAAPHAVLSRWLDDDHQAASKPYSVTPPVAGPRGLTLGVGLVDDALAPRLLAHTAPGSHVRLGRYVYRVHSAPTKQAETSWTALEQGSGATAWCLTFHTPTTFREGNRSSPWPAPQSIVRSLTARWRAVRGDISSVAAAADASLWVSDIEGFSRAFPVGGLTVSGFVGRIRMVCETVGAGAAAVDRLLRLSPYSGVGSFTARGLGTVSLSTTWQPSPAR
jgi:CRISPR-associated endoribonuclease Cas6